MSRLYQPYHREPQSPCTNIYDNLKEPESFPFPHLDLTPCQNCNQYHQPIANTYWQDCIMIGCRSHTAPRSARSPSSSPHSPPSPSQPSSPSRLRTIPMPTNIRDQARLFDDIWFWFLDMKHENDDAREELSTARRNKGSLRAKAPLLWLQWKRWDGEQGQTRNQENYEKLWKTFVKAAANDGRLLPVAYLTIRSMPFGDGVPMD